MSIRIDCEEDGFWLTVEDDEDNGMPVCQGKDWPYAPDVTGYRLRLTDPDQLYNLVKDVIGPWIAKRESARASMPADFGHDEDEGYALDDPKHSSYHQRMAGYYDEREK